MKLLRYSALAKVVSAARKYNCQWPDSQRRAEELSHLLLKEFLVDGVSAVRSARLFFLPCDQPSESTKRAVMSESEITGMTSQSTKLSVRNGTVMYLEHSDNEIAISGDELQKNPRRRKVRRLLSI